MAFTFIARMKILPEKRDQFITACEKLENAVKENENAYAVIESFESEEMDEEHQQTQHFKDIVPELLECLDGTYTREFLDPLRQNND